MSYPESLMMMNARIYSHETFIDMNKVYLRFFTTHQLGFAVITVYYCKSKSSVFDTKVIK